MRHPKRIAFFLPVLAFCACLASAGTARAATATLDPAGFVRVDGEPFFPIGMFHVSWIGDRQGVKSLPDLHEIADAGFNLISPTIDSRPDEAEFLDAAADRGLYVIGEIGWAAANAIITKWKDRSAMIGWYIADDFNAPFSGPPRHPPEELAERHAFVKSIAPEHLTHASGGSFPGFTIEPYLGTMDLMSFQSYPINAGNYDFDYWLQENADSWDYVRGEIGAFPQLFIANPQAFKWDDPGARHPTLQEARNMLYVPLLRGAKGVIWYTFYDGGPTLPKRNPAFWAELAREVVELKSLTPFLLFGELTDIATGSSRVYAGSFELDRQLVVVVLSTEREVSTPVSLDLPDDVVPVAHRMFPGRPESGLMVAGDDLTGSVGPEEVHVYVIDRATPGNQPPEPEAQLSPDPIAFGQDLTLDASGSTDPDGDVVSWSWDFGDGSLGSGEVVQHDWAEPGTYHVRLTVRDDDGDPATTIFPVEIALTSLCGEAPRAGCEEAPRAHLSLKQPGAPTKRSLLWKWRKGEVALADLESPLSTTEYALCVYDANGRVLATGAQPSATKWRALGPIGFRYSDSAGVPGGLTSAVLRSGAGTAGVLQWKGKGARLPEVPLPLALPVTAQVVTNDGTACWQTSFTAGPKVKNLPTSFTATR